MSTVGPGWIVVRVPGANTGRRATPGGATWPAYVETEVEVGARLRAVETEASTWLPHHRDTHMIASPRPTATGWDTLPRTAFPAEIVS
jgi:hypothetical protein